VAHLYGMSYIQETWLTSDIAPVKKLGLLICEGLPGHCQNALGAELQPRGLARWLSHLLSAALCDLGPTFWRHTLGALLSGPCGLARLRLGF
jgi:hypothetical protein